MDEKFLSTQEVTWLYGITKQGLGKWVERGFPKSKRNEYPLKAGLDWVRGNVWSTPDGAGDMAGFKLREQKAKAEQREMDVEKQRGSLVPREQSLIWLSRLLAEIKLHFLGLPRRLAGSLIILKDEREVESVLKHEITRILWTLSKPLPHKERRKKPRRRAGRTKARAKAAR